MTSVPKQHCVKFSHMRKYHYNTHIGNYFTSTVLWNFKNPNKSITFSRTFPNFFFLSLPNTDYSQFIFFT